MIMKNRKQKENTSALTKIDDKHFQVDETVLIRSHLKGCGRLIGDDELTKLVGMHKDAAYVNKRMRKRVLMALLFLFIPIGCALIFPKVISFPVAMLLGILLAGFLWFSDMNATKKYSTNNNVQRSISWARFVRMAAAYLTELKRGNNLYNIFEKMVPRLATKEDRDNLQLLMVRMGRDPEDPQPFLDFAHAYPNQQSTEMVMLVIHDMYLGNVSDENIQSLANEATKDLTSQIDVIIEHKLSRFKSTGTKILAISMLPMVAYMGSYVVTTIMKMLGGIGK